MIDDVKYLNTMLSDISLSLKSSVYGTINEIANINSSVFEKEPLNTICNLDIFLIVIFVLWSVIIYCGIRVLITMYSNVVVEKIYYYVFKIALITIVSLNSYNICKYIVSGNNSLTEIITFGLEEVVDTKIEYNFFDDNVDTLDKLISNSNKLSLNGVKDFVVCLYLISLLIMLSLRYVVVIFCIIVSPFVFFMLLIPKIEAYFYVWLKIFLYALIIQNVNVLIIFIPIAAKSDDIIFLPVVIGSVILMYNVNKKAGGYFYENKN